MDTHQKALQLNLDSNKYGTIAEIGAGQEVARWFFRVGAAAGTVAKTMSAYDMKVSDAIYGQSSRYVSRDRVEAMLDHEWRLLLERLDGQRGEDATFFVFSDTISARNYQGTNICHGWMGVRFQIAPRSKPCTICLHVNMGDETNILQQQAVGILGINLIYGAFNCDGDIQKLISQLMDELSLSRIDVDFISADGPLFEEDDPCAVNLGLLLNEATPAVGFSTDGKPACPMNFLYKRPVIIERGRFDSVHKVHEDLLISGSEQFKKEGIETKRSPVEVLETTIHNANESEEVGASEILRRLSLMKTLKRPSLATSYTEGYRLTRFLRRYTPEHVRYVMGVDHMIQIFNEGFYENLSGGIIEALGRLLSEDVKLYVSPMPAEALKKALNAKGAAIDAWALPVGGSATLANVHPIDATRHLYSYLFEVGAIHPMAEV